jgi:hypothetical protein
MAAWRLEMAAKNQRAGCVPHFMMCRAALPWRFKTLEKASIMGLFKR